MASINQKLANVAFGGGWSEELLAGHELAESIQVIERAVNSCFEKDVRSEELEEALTHISTRLHKGQTLRQAFVASLSFSDPYTREAMARDVLNRIKNVYEMG